MLCRGEVLANFNCVKASKYEIYTLYSRSGTVIQKSGRNLKIPGAKRVTCSKSHTEDLQILGVIVNHLRPIHI
jgi:hypothetical protein